jgi:hypothetical protein
VVLSVLIAVPLTVYMIGVCRTLAATAGRQETLYAVLALHGGGAGLAVR